MFEENNSIIIVDDQQEHLNRLSNIFCRYGIACRTLLYEAMPNISPLTGVKIAFFDVILTNAGEESAQLATLSDAMKTYISSDNNPFILVLWTNNPEYKDKLIDFINRPGNSNQMPKPIEIEVIDKNEFLENEEELQARLVSLMNEQIVKCLFSFESELREASDKSLSEVIKLVPFPDAWGKHDEFVKNVKTVFANIALEAFGRKRGISNPDLAIKEVFAPLILHHLCSSNSTIWKDFFDGENIKKVQPFPNPEIVANLNTIFHLDYAPADIESRGIVRRIDIKNPEIAKLFKEIVKYDPEEWINSVLLNNCKHQGNYKELVAIEVSAACDYANNKKRTHEYLLGLLLPNRTYLEVEKAHFSDAVFHVPFMFVFRSEICNMLLHFNFMLTEEETSPIKLLDEPLFRFKNEIMNMIGDRHARHISRIGITSFK